jgi:hypothetical protein
MRKNTPARNFGDGPLRAQPDREADNTGAGQKRPDVDAQRRQHDQHDDRDQHDMQAISSSTVSGRSR